MDGDIENPCSEVWICRCGKHLIEPGLCWDCSLQEAEPLRFPGLFTIMAFLILAGLVGATALILRAAWLMYATFS
jgi:hypothetical protein